MALQGAILITGGLGGVMESASKVAKDRGGLVVGVIPQDEKCCANAFCDVVISTGLGYSRNFVTAYSGDAVIVVGGGIGTAIEAGVAYQKGKPIITIQGSGGIADEIGGKYLDDRQVVKVMKEKDPRTAVKKAYLALTNSFTKKRKAANKCRGDILKAKFKEISLSTKEELDLVDITEQVSSFARDFEIESGICIINSPHSTIAVIVNEHESRLMEDILRKVREEFPKGAGWHHDRGNGSANAHLASIFLGHSKIIPIRNGRLERGTWQNIFLLELDGPRGRRVLFEVI